MCGWRRRALEAPVVLLTMAATDRFLACGPFFPNRLLVDGDARVLLAPRADFYPRDRALVAGSPADAPARGKIPTSQADQADLALALEASGMPPERRAELIARHKALRDALTRIAPERDSWKRRSDSSKDVAAAREAAAGQALEVPEGLPPEFEDYLQGAVLYHRGNFEEARTRWEALLARPPAERVHRSTWAAFMLGKSWLEEDLAAAAGWFRKVRELAGESCADSLGLAAASLGWEAMADLERGDFVSATGLYSGRRRAASGRRTHRFASWPPPGRGWGGAADRGKRSRHPRGHHRPHPERTIPPGRRPGLAIDGKGRCLAQGGGAGGGSVHAGSGPDRVGLLQAR